MTSRAEETSGQRDDTSSRPATSPTIPLLRVPLVTKLVGANLVIVVLAWLAVFAGGQAESRWTLLSVVTVALALGLIVNLVLVAIALRPIKDLERTATRLWAGDLEARVPRSAVADANLEQIGGMLNFLLGVLVEDREQVRALASKVVQSGDRARARVARELHDSVAQALAALRYQLVAIEKAATEPELADQLRAVRIAAGEVLEQVRLLSHTVHPRILDDLGIVAALKHLARTSIAPPTVSVTVAEGMEARLRSIEPEVAAVLYTVAQEAIANAIRHGAPSRVDLSLAISGRMLTMHVDDDGSGFDPGVARRWAPSLGLFTMRERTLLSGGVFEVVSSAGGGTSIRVRIPLEASAAPRSADAPSIPEDSHVG